MVLFKRTGYNDRMQQISVRIGNSPVSPEHGLKQISANYDCGTSSARTDTAVEVVDCGSARSGRYMTLQSHAAKMINMAEINVYAGREPGEMMMVVNRLYKFVRHLGLSRGTFESLVCS